MRSIVLDTNQTPKACPHCQGELESKWSDPVLLRKKWVCEKCEVTWIQILTLDTRSLGKAIHYLG